jgi:FkbM family methyltransferase
MKALQLRFIKAVYRLIPTQPMRRSAVGLFARAVRNRQVSRSVDGVTFVLDLGETIDLSLYLGTYEPDVCESIRRFTRPGMTILDIGANIGAHTFLLGRLTGPDGLVVAFEPTDFAFAKLQCNMSKNDFRNIESVKLALSDRRLSAQEVEFRASWRTDGSRADGVSLVEFERLDSWLESRGLGRIDLVKIDVDGHEFDVITGAGAMLRRDRPLLIMEAVGPHFDNDSRNPYRVLAEIGYCFEDAKTGEPLSLTDMRDRLPRGDTGMTISFNVIAAPEPTGRK